MISICGRAATPLTLCGPTDTHTAQVVARPPLVQTPLGLWAGYEWYYHSPSHIGTVEDTRIAQINRTLDGEETTKRRVQINGTRLLLPFPCIERNLLNTDDTSRVWYHYKNTDTTQMSTIRG